MVRDPVPYSLAICALALLASGPIGACVLNPQPLPPDAPDSGAQGSAVPASDAGASEGGEDANEGGGTGSDGGVDDSTDGEVDAQSGAADASSDAPAEDALSGVDAGDAGLE